MTLVSALHMVTACIAAAAALLSLIRIGRGPTQLDRAIASDVLTASGIVLIAVMIVTWSRPDLALAFILLALTAFLGPVAIARFARKNADTPTRILTHEESLRLSEEREEEAMQAELDELAQSEEEARGVSSRLFDDADSERATDIAREEQ